MTIEIPKKNAPDSHFEILWQECLTNQNSSRLRGSNRDIYFIPEHEDKVLKVMNRPSHLPNWTEIIVWNSISDSDKEYFAEVLTWSISGKFLVMERLNTPVTIQNVIDMFPPILNDIKPENFGSCNSGNIKVLDYGMIKIPQHNKSYIFE